LQFDVDAGNQAKTQGNQMKVWRAVALATVFMGSSIAIAGDQPLYQPAPAWIITAPLSYPLNLAASDVPILLDVQHRVDGPTVWKYADTVVRIDTTEALAQNSDITVAWSPDKGDLIVHQLSILREGKEIDALANGQRFTVLRREQQLEQRALTGVLTATLAVEGLRVGDAIRIRMSTTEKDNALGGRAQLTQPIIAEPVRISTASYKLSWRTKEAAKWKILAQKIEAIPVQKGDFSELVIRMPVAKQPEMPDDAPGRFQNLQFVEASTFTDWADVSRTMAPLYATDGLVPDDGVIADEISTIKAATNDPLRRAAMALQLVQDKIRYLAIGMNGGNYVPQSPLKTWELRYGDCKAKTLLLLAVLRAMDIEAEPVLAHSALGDVVPTRVPSALAFNHVLVRATINGESLWLDGTGLGTRLADIRDTPPFGHLLPVRASGADLEKIALRPPARATIDLMMEADESTSVDLPSVIDLNMTVRGELASMLTLATSQLPLKEQRDFIDQMMQRYVGQAQYEFLTATPDAENGTVTIKGKGIFTTGWKLQDRQTERWLSRLPSLLEFEPDRARSAWADIPVVTSVPEMARYRMRIKLPDGGRGYTIEGEPDLNKALAGTLVNRSIKMANGFVEVDETLSSTGAEIPAAQIAAERDLVTTSLARSPRMIAPENARRRWNLDGAGSTSQINTIKAVYAKNDAKADEQNITSLISSASFYRGIGDYKAAMEPLTKQITLLPSVDSYLGRAAVRRELGDIAGALADAQQARKLDPASPSAIVSVASYTAEQGDLPSALALLDERIALGGKTRDDYRVERAAIAGEFGDATAALADLDALIAEKPGSPVLLNHRCWLKATKNIQIESALKDCTSAIELSDSTAQILDSRALVWVRMGRNEDALRDLDAALLQSPALAPARFLRAIVNKRLGRTDQAAIDLAVARRMFPSIEPQYARFGLQP
jgi:tetratricopeptide (TPR) repeat protein